MPQITQIITDFFNGIFLIFLICCYIIQVFVIFLINKHKKKRISIEMRFFTFYLKKLCFQTRR